MDIRLGNVDGLLNRQRETVAVAVILERGGETVHVLSTSSA